MILFRFDRLDFDEEDIIERTPLIDFITIKEIFRFTLKWRNPEIQKLILEKVDEAQHASLLSSENINVKRPIFIDLVDIDNVPMTETVLSAVKNENMFLYRSGDDGRNPLLHAMIYARGYSIMESLFQAIQVCYMKFSSERCFEIFASEEFVALFKEQFLASSKRACICTRFFSVSTLTW